MENQMIQSKIEKNQYLNTFSMCTFVQHKIKIIQDLKTHDLFCVVNIKMTLAEQEKTLKKIQRPFGNYIEPFYFR